MKTAVTFFMLLCSTHLAHAQEPRKQQKLAVFDSARSALRELTNKFGNNPVSDQMQTETVQSLANIGESVKFLDGAIRRSRKQVPKEYLESVGLDAKLLKRLAKLDYNSESQRKRVCDELKEVESDLALKVTGPGRRGGGEVIRLVEVFVHAKKGGLEMGAYEVWYVPKGWVSEPSVFKRFDRLTDPANPPSMNLAPGNYFIWLSKVQPLTDRQPVSIGAYGEVKRELDVSVP
jgi:hypothetical protein